MKKTLLFMLAISLWMSTSASAQINNQTNKTTEMDNQQEWKKSKDGTWMGKDNRWYKLDENGTLWVARDKKNWESSKDGTWQDKDGKWYKVTNKKLMWSTDGVTWAEVSESKWKGPDGIMYKYNSSDGSIHTMIKDQETERDKTRTEKQQDTDLNEGSMQK